MSLTGSRLDDRDLVAARERRERRGDPLSRAAARAEWDRRAKAVVEKVRIDDVIGRVVQLARKGMARRLSGLCPFHDESTPSFSVYPWGGTKVKVGFFVCHGCDARGDVIAFVMRRQKLGFQDAVRWLEGGRTNIEALGRAPAPLPRPKAIQADEQRRIDEANDYWTASVPLGAGGVVDLYLRGRAIVPPGEYGICDPAVNGGWPVELRFLERCWHNLERRTFPAMIAAIRDPATGEMQTVHRTYLARQADGRWTKAKIEKTKLVVGTWSTGYIALGPVADRMIGGEGIETTLSAMQLSKRSGLAFVNSGRMKSIDLPFLCADFIYAADKGGKSGTRWGEIFAQEGARKNASGRTVAVRIPKIAAAKGDFNDLVMIRAGLMQDDPSPVESVTS